MSYILPCKEREEEKKKSYDEWIANGKPNKTKQDKTHHMNEQLKEYLSMIDVK